MLLIGGIIGSCANLHAFSRKHMRQNPYSHYILHAGVFDFVNTVRPSYVGT